MASRPRTVKARPSTLTTSTVVTPSRFGRGEPRWAKMPTLGQLSFPRGCRADVFTLAGSSRSNRNTITAWEKASSPCSASSGR